MFERLFGCKHNWIEKGDEMKAYALTEKGKKVPIVFVREYVCKKCGKEKVSANLTLRELYKHWKYKK